MVGYPGILMEKTNFWMITTNRYIIDSKEEISPKKVDMRKGKVVKDMNPSTAYLNNFLKDHFVSPEFRFWAS